jgi:hypothetical protein
MGTTSRTYDTPQHALKGRVRLDGHAPFPDLPSGCRWPTPPRFEFPGAARKRWLRTLKPAAACCSLRQFTCIPYTSAGDLETCRCGFRVRVTWGTKRSAPARSAAAGGGGARRNCLTLTAPPPPRRPRTPPLRRRRIPRHQSPRGPGRPAAAVRRAACPSTISAASHAGAAPIWHLAMRTQQQPETAASRAAPFAAALVVPCWARHQGSTPFVCLSV